MAEEMFGKYAGTGLIDAQSIKGELVDIKGGDLQGYKREKPGLEPVLEELARVMPTSGDAAGIHPHVYQSFKAKTELLAKIRALRPLVAKLNEVLYESEIFYEDAREGDIIRMAKSVLDAAHHGNQPALLAVFERMLQYRSQYGEKAAASRRKNNQARAEAPKPAPEGSPPARAPKPPSGKKDPLGADPEKPPPLAARELGAQVKEPLAQPGKELEDAGPRDVLPALPARPRGHEEALTQQQSGEEPAPLGHPRDARPRHAVGRRPGQVDAEIGVEVHGVEERCPDDRGQGARSSPG